MLLASELIRNYEKPSCPKSAMLKVDIRKAFDTVCWDFILKILEAQNFPPMFCTWIKECISSTPISVSELAGFFAGQQGIRQGDSVSPYLFITVMEMLSKLLENSAGNSSIRLHPNFSSPTLTHLLFADDLLSNSAAIHRKNHSKVASLDGKISFVCSKSEADLFSNLWNGKLLELGFLLA